MRVRDARERVRDVLIRWHRGSRGGLQLCDDVEKKLVVQFFLSFEATMAQIRIKKKIPSSSGTWLVSKRSEPFKFVSIIKTPL